MHRAKVIFAIYLLAVSSTAWATDVKVGPFSVSLPPGFTGPVRGTPDANSETVAYSSGGESGEPSNVIQFTRYAIGSAPPNADEDTYAEGAKSYLQQMLQGIERRRTHYVQSPVIRTHLAGHVGARANWSGTLEGLPTNGVMYCTIIGTDAWFIHVFGSGDRPGSALQSAITAVERKTASAP